MIPKDVHIIFRPKMQGQRSVSLSNSSIRRLLGKNTEKVIEVAKTTKKEVTIMKFRVMGEVEIRIK